MSDPSPEAERTSREGTENPEAVPEILSVQTTQEGGGVVRVALTGELDIATVPAVESALQAVEPDASTVILDLAALSFIDSMGIRLLVNANQRARRGTFRLLVSRGSGQVRQLLELTGVADRLELTDSL